MKAEALVKALLEDDINAFLSDTKAAFADHMEERRIDTYLEIVTEESAANGEAESNEQVSALWEESDAAEDSSPEELVDSACAALMRTGVSEASASFFHPGVWYNSQQEAEYDEGRTYWTQQSYHLKNFTEDEEKRIYAFLKQHKHI